MRPASFAAQLRADLPISAVVRVLEVFRAETVTLVSALNGAARADDCDAFRRVAHSIAGSAATVGAKALEEHARLAVAIASTQPARLTQAADEVTRLGADACGYAASLIDELA